MHSPKKSTERTALAGRTTDRRVQVHQLQLITPVCGDEMLSKNNFPQVQNVPSFAENIHFIHYDLFLHVLFPYKNMKLTNQ